MGTELPVVNRQTGNGSKGTEVCFLAGSPLRVIRPGHHKGSEIPDTADVIPWEEHTAQLLDVKPFIGSVFNAAIIQIEPIHINVRLDFHSSKNAQAARRLPGTLPANRTEEADYRLCQLKAFVKPVSRYGLDTMVIPPDTISAPLSRQLPGLLPASHFLFSSY